MQVLQSPQGLGYQYHADLELSLCSRAENLAHVGAQWVAAAVAVAAAGPRGSQVRGAGLAVGFRAVSSRCQARSLPTTG